jgi:hypothetical protein
MFKNGQSLYVSSTVYHATQPGIMVTIFTYEAPYISCPTKSHTLANALKEVCLAGDYFMLYCHTACMVLSE